MSSVGHPAQVRCGRLSPLLRVSSLCYGDDDDLCYIDLASPQMIVIDPTDIPAGTNYDLSLWYGGSMSQPVVRSAKPGTSAERIRYNASRAGR